MFFIEILDNEYILWVFFSQNEYFYKTLSRKKTLADGTEPEKEKFERVLNVFDLTALGIGCTLGCGIYVLAGTVAKSIAGPAVVLSFLVAAIVSSFSGIKMKILHNIYLIFFKLGYSFSLYTSNIVQTETGVLFHYGQV